MLCVFFSSYVFKNERKESKTLNTFDLMLKAKVINFKENFNIIIHEGLKIRSQMHFILSFRIHNDGRILGI
jgi:hypothetical protein